MKKTFKIGESAIGGIIRVTKNIKRQTNQDVCSVEIIDWDSKKVIQWRYVYGADEMYNFLSEITTHYWADKITKHFN